MESELQVRCNDYLRENGIFFDHFEKGRGGQRQSKMHSKGRPDFFIWHNSKHIVVEIKTETGKQSKKQKEYQDRIESSGFAYLLIDNFEDFCEVVDVYLKNNL